TFFSNQKVLTAIAMYITIVGLVYNTILRFQWQPKGLQLIVDELLHSVIPVLFIVFWFLFVPKAYLKAKDIFPWLLYPLFYIIYILIRGSINGVYPYPFVDVVQLGFSKVFLNSGILVMVFVAFSFLYVALDRFAKK
ncbi:MAG: Pr6Pr family membrane protein, partial [Ginsengibacter sp.]